jgi:hypothetical protein
MKKMLSSLTLINGIKVMKRFFLCPHPLRVISVPLMVLTCAFLLSACGSSGNSSVAVSTSGGTIKAVIKTGSQVAFQNVAGIQLAISVPVGVAPPLKADGTVDGAATVTMTGSAPSGQKLSSVLYTPATSGKLGKLEIFGIEAAGFKPTDEITIHLKVAVGSFPVEGDFKLLSFAAFDTNGAVIEGLSPVLTTTIQ